jgi:hypothetical protein
LQEYDFILGIETLTVQIIAFDSSRRILFDQSESCSLSILS